MKRSCLVVVGEKSGEEHFFSFFPELQKQLPDTLFFGVGGDEMQDVGVELLYHLNDFSSFGFSDVIKKIPFYFNALNKLMEEVELRKVETAILVDFQGFNLKLAQRLKKKGVNVLYYVAPQAWAWRSHRARPLSRSVHTLFTLLPFEKDWYHRRGVQKIVSVEHPLIKKHASALEKITPKVFPEKRKWRLVLLPGSRNTEVRYLMPVFNETAKLLKSELPIEVVLVKTSSVNKAYYALHSDAIDYQYDSHQLDEVLSHADLAIAASGTVTLSTALFEIPTIVTYKTSLFNAFIYHNLVSYRGPASLTNIIAGHYVFPELYQEGCMPLTLRGALLKWISSPQLYEQTVQVLRSIRDKLTGDEVNISEYMASVIKKNHVS